MKFLYYRPEVNGLRGIAVLGAVFYHAEIILGTFRIFPGGFLGVCVVFAFSPVSVFHCRSATQFVIYSLRSDDIFQHLKAVNAGSLDLLSPHNIHRITLYHPHTKIISSHLAEL